jgi:hypothetical protein
MRFDGATGVVASREPGSGQHVIPRVSVAAFRVVMLDAAALIRVDCAAGYDGCRWRVRPGPWRALV